MAERDGTIGMIEGSYRHWFTELAGGAEITEVWRSERAQSALARYEISDGPAVRSVMVKHNSLDADVAERPRLGLRSEFEKKHLYEAAALSAIHHALSKRSATSDNDRFDSVRVLEVFDGGLVLDVVGGRDLGSILRRTHGIRAAGLIRGCGELLRLVHSAEVDLPTARGTGFDLARSFEDFSRFLAPELVAVPNLTEQLDRIATALSALEQMEVALGHGDFAPRNVLVGDGQRLTIIDPLGCQRVPVEEDLSYFALAMRKGALVPWLQPLSERIAARLERELLAGYGMTPGFRYHAISTLVALDALAADKVRHMSRAGMAKRLVARTLPDQVSLVRTCAKKALDAHLSDGVDA